MSGQDRGWLWREAAVGLFVALAGMAALSAVGLGEVAWVAPFLVAVRGGVRHGRGDCRGSTANAQ